MPTSTDRTSGFSQSESLAAFDGLRHNRTFLRVWRFCSQAELLFRLHKVAGGLHGYNIPRQ
jgi:hypothetical protein